MTMNTAAAHEASRDDIYDPEDVGLRDSPPPRIYKPKLQPTPSPSPEDPDSDDSSPPASPDKRKAKRPVKSVPSQGDAVLIGLLGGGKTPEVARTAATEILASGSDDEDMADESQKGVAVGAQSTERPLDLEALAAGALKAHAAHAAVAPSSIPALQSDEKPRNPPNGVVETSVQGDKSESLEDASRSAPNANSQDNHELAPIQERSPKSEKVNNLTLPSISAQLGNIDDLKHLAEAATSTVDMSTSNVHRPSFSQSPPQPPLFQVRDTATSPPISPNENFRRELPSPGRAPVSAASYYYNNNPRRPSQASDSQVYALTPADYSSSATETPSTDQSGSTPAGIPVPIDRMSIDGITNPPVGGFQCLYPGCTAQPFQTQYLLNSHANVHSSNRPHYCPVKGCPRSEGGKGFKRKNEMIRHGLVHESPGYVCPYCVDREHKYPRPDNLQRHVRVHHVDKDKDDPQLREVLAQRPEGPSRGRRRRGGTN